MSEERSKQELPAEMVHDLLGAIKRDFCGTMDAQQWRQSVPMFRRVVTHPAACFVRQGVSFAPERYKAIVLDILQEVKRHAKEGVRYWPGYLLKCVQAHMRIQGEKYYKEGKAIRAAVERAKLAFTRTEPVAGAPAADAIEALAAVNRVLSLPKRGKGAKAKAAEGVKQGEFFRL